MNIYMCVMILHMYINTSGYILPIAHCLSAIPGGAPVFLFNWNMKSRRRQFMISDNLALSSGSTSWFNFHIEPQQGPRPTRGQ